MVSSYRVRQWDSLLKISKALTAQLDLDAVLTMILQAAAGLLSGQAALIALRQQDGKFAIHAVHGLPVRLLEYFRTLLSDIPEQADRADFLIPGLASKLRQVAVETGLPLRQVVALPMAMGETLVGVLYVFRVHGGRFTTDDRRVLTSFADQAAIAVHNAQLYQQLHYEKRRLDAILDYSADGVAALDAAQKIVMFNRALAELTGWSPSDAIGRHHDEVIAWHRLETELDLTRAVAGGWPLLTDGGSNAPLYVEGDLKQRKGGRVSVGITYAPLFDREGRLVNVIVSARDISRFREADRLKDTFISVVSHELKTPVTVVQGYAETLNRPDVKWDEETVRDGLAAIEEETQRLTRLIDDLLDVSRLRAGALALQMEDVALDALAKRVAQRFRPQSEAHEITVDFPTKFPTIEGDSGRLEQVLSNLVSNAIRYSPDGGLVRISGAVRSEEVVVSVADEGIGIAVTEQPHIFEPFYRVEGSTSRRTSGAGLGLYLAKELVGVHGGRIWVESEPGEGATFSIALPLPPGQ